MTYYFGFATQKHIYLAADRRRLGEAPTLEVDDTASKIHKVSRWSYLVGAGFMHFVDDTVASQAGSVFGHDRLDLKIVEKGLPKLASQLKHAHAQLATQVGRPVAALPSRFTLVGIDTSNVPFSLGWTSDEGFQPLSKGPHAFSLPREPSELADLGPMFGELRKDVECGVSFNRVATGAASIIAWVAQRDEMVSRSGDFIRLGGIRNRRVQFH